MMVRVGWALAGCLLVLAAIAGCAGGASGSAGDAAGGTSSFPPPPADPDSPAGVAVEALRRIYSWQPAAEQPGAAMQRAKPLLGPHLSAVLDAGTGAVGLPKTDARWAEWAAAQARVDAVAFASAEQAPDETADRRQLKIGVAQTVIYPSGRSETLPSAVIVATVVRTVQGWRLDDFG